MSQSSYNPRLKDGDSVVLRYPHKAEHGYMYDHDTGIGTYDTLYALAGAPGVVVKARTPKIFSKTGDLYFANVDVQVMPGVKVRVRCDHHFLSIKRGAAAA